MSVRVRIPMVSRDPDEAHRASTPLELFFDLTFVVAIAQAANSLHHGLAEGHAADVLVGYPLVFFGIWWAWMNFTWFASAYDTDDVLYRLAVLRADRRRAGLRRRRAAGHGAPGLHGRRPRLRDHADRPDRASGCAPPAPIPSIGACCLRYAGGIFVCQLCWIGLLARCREALFLPGFLVLAAAELPCRSGPSAPASTTWHPRHIAERYGLFTIIVLGESVLAATIACRARSTPTARWRSSARSPSAAC